MKTLLLSLLLAINQQADTGQDHLLDKFTAAFQRSVHAKLYRTDEYIKPLYLVSDFNGDKENDIAVLITNIKTQERGFIIYHFKGKTFHIVGAGKVYNDESKSADLDWMDNWEINTSRSNNPGVQGGPPLELDFDSINITHDGVGGGLIYWNGEQYGYFHQTC